MTETYQQYKFPWHLFTALMLLTFVPSVYQTFRVYFLVTSGTIESLDIIGHLEWFDLINETLQAFLLIPLYYILGKFIQNRTKFAEKITQTGVITFFLYLTFSILVYLSALNITEYMASGTQNLAEITNYLQLETIGFSIGIIGSFFGIVYVLIGKPRYIYVLLIVKTVLIILGDSILIPAYGVNGVAYTNILLNVFIAAVSIGLLHYEGLFHPRFGKLTDVSWLFDWAKTGLFAGATILLDNIIYMLIVVKMINDVAEVGNYWVANNFIWGWLLIPTIALAEIIRRECVNGCRQENFIAYLRINGLILLVWIVTIPIWPFVFTDLMAIENSLPILSILALLVPFYIIYNFCSLFDNIFYSLGKTLFVFITSLVVNIGYYGVMYLLFLEGVFTESLTYVILLFGCGMVVHLGTVVILYIYAGKKYGSVWIGENMYLRKQNGT